MSNNLPGTRIQLHMAKLAVYHPKTFKAAAEIMGSRPGFKVTGLVLTNKDGETWVINSGGSLQIAQPKTL